MGGGGRGMRVVQSADKLEEAIESARREAGAAFGVADVFLEKFVQRAKHIEVQLIGDRHGGLVHLFERDCSIQRRHQKVVELAPAPNLPGDVRQADPRRGPRGRARRCGIDNAGTVEFLFDTDAEQFYFIEVNPRIQVEHTVTEEVTGYRHRSIADPDRVGAAARPTRRSGCEQSTITTHGFAIQCRVTTEDPANGFVPGLRPAERVPLERRAGHPARRGHRVRRGGHHALLRLAAGEGDGERAALRRRRQADGAVPAGVPRPRREDEHPVPAEPRSRTRSSSPAT